MQIRDRVFECHESLTGVAAHSGTWLTVGDLLAAHKEINLQFTFKVSLAVSMDEKLKRKHYDGVPGYVRQPMQVGNEDVDVDFQDEVGEMGGEVKVEDSKHEGGLFHSVGFAGPKDVATLQEVMAIEEILRMSQSSWQEQESETKKIALSQAEFELEEIEAEIDTVETSEVVYGAVYSSDNGWSVQGQEINSEIIIEEVLEDEEAVVQVEHMEKEVDSNGLPEGTKMQGIEDLIRSDEEQEKLKKEKWSSYEDFVWEGRKAIVPSNVNKVEASILLTRAVKAVLRHEKEAYNKQQSKIDPGDGWINLYGILMEQVIIYTEIVFSDRPAPEHSQGLAT